MPISSFNAPEDVLTKLDDLASAAQVSKSAILRQAITKLHEEKTMQSPSIDTIASAENLVADFFNKATAKPDTNWTVVKFQAADILGKYAELRFPTLTAEAAMAKLAELGNQDAVTKVLYQLVNLRSEAEFSAYKAAVSGGE